MANELLMAYSVLNESYRNGLVKKIEGPAAADADTVAQINNPDETYVPLGTAEGDPKLFSYAYGQDPMVLIARVTTTPGTQPSSCLYTLAAPDAGGGKAWKILARDIVLNVVNNAATNPYGLAQVGTKIYLIDYDTLYNSQYIYPLGVNELNGLPPGDHHLDFAPFDVGTAAGLPATAKGQAIIALKDASGNSFLYALYTDNNLTTGAWGASVLVKLQVVPVTGINPSGLVYVDQVSLALNAQEIIPVTYSNAVKLLIPSIGGPQKYDGTTNGTASKIQLVDPFPSTSPWTAADLITGDPSGTAGSYDIRAVAAPAQDNANADVFILTGTMGTDYRQNWTLYRSTLSKILTASNTTLSGAVSQGILTMKDSGTSSPGSYWDIYIETGTVPKGNRLYFLRGSPIQVVSAYSYSTGGKIFDAGYGAGDIGGLNVDSAVLVAETLRQAALGVSYKRGLRGAPAQAAKAPEEEEK
jgi:hypothetical protein